VVEINIKISALFYSPFIDLKQVKPFKLQGSALNNGQYRTKNAYLSYRLF